VRTRQRFVVGILLCLTSASIPLAFAQSHGKGRGKTPKPTPSVAPIDAAVDEPSSASQSSLDAAPASSGRDLYFYDGGERPSPLNPQANEFPMAAPSLDASAVDYDKLIGDISSLRARVAAVGDTLFHSKIAIAVRTDGRAKIGRMVVSLDDGAVYSAPSNFHSDDTTTIYEHAVAPGHHAITVDIDRNDDRDETFRTSQRSRFIVDVVKDERLAVDLRVGDESTMGADFPSDHSGHYDLRVRMKATSRPLGK
jgi:hypothetical protein